MKKKIINNKYISKSLIYISNERLIYNNNINKDILYLISKFKNIKFYRIFENKYNYNEDKNKKLLNIDKKIIN